MWIDGEDNEIVRALIGDDEMFAVGKNVEISRHATLNVHVLQERQVTRAWVDRVNSQRIMATVGYVEELLVGWMEENLRACVGQCPVGG